MDNRASIIDHVLHVFSWSLVVQQVPYYDQIEKYTHLKRKHNFEWWLKTDFISQEDKGDTFA